MNNIDKNSPIPIYYQIKEHIRALIEDGELKPGMRVPSERCLSEQYGISRMTARQALSELVKEGLLYRAKGLGTFVAQPKLDQPIMKLSSFSEDMHKRGMQAGAKTINAEVINPGPIHIRKALNLSDEEPILKLERLRYANDIPMVLEITHFSYKKFHYLENIDLEHNSLYEILAKQFGVHIASAKEMLEAVLSDEYTAPVLGIKEGMPLVMITAVTFDDKGEPVEYVRSYYRGDKYKFYLELR